MTERTIRRYRFKTAEQWDACLFVEAARGVPEEGAGLRPFAPYAVPPTEFPTPQARCPVVTSTGGLLWTDDLGTLFRLSADEEHAQRVPAPIRAGSISRIVAMGEDLCIIGEELGTLEIYEESTLARRLTVQVGESRPVDLAGGGRRAVWALVQKSHGGAGGGRAGHRDSTWEVVEVEAGGRVGTRVALGGLVEPLAFAYLSRSKWFVVLTGERSPRLRWFTATGRPLFSLTVGGLRPCLRAECLGSDGVDRLFVAGVDDRGLRHVVVCDADGSQLTEVPVGDHPVTGLAARREILLVTRNDRVLQFTTGVQVPEDSEGLQCMVLTPVLFSKDREDGRRWLRVEALADLPEGTTLELAVGSTDDQAERDRLTRVATDESIPASHRVRQLLSEPDIWRALTVYHGRGVPDGGDALPIYSAPLFDVHDRYLWVCLTLIAAPGGRLPAVRELAIRYPGRSLMEQLPAVYRRGEETPGDFLRSLVGVLEATTQDLDDRIASMGTLLDPSAAPGPWLDFVARWLGVPWDDALTPPQKRRLLSRSAALARHRGTHAGLELLLEILMPGVPRRFRVTDATAEQGFAFVAGSASHGSTLPAMLGGRPPWHAELDAGAVLGQLRLPCGGQRDDAASWLTGRVRVDLAATAEERLAWEPWILGLLMQMVPMTARIRLRFVGPNALRPHRLDGILTLAAPPVPHLGTDAITDLARMPERGARLRAGGSEPGTRLG